MKTELLLTNHFPDHQGAPVAFSMCVFFGVEGGEKDNMFLSIGQVAVWWVYHLPMLWPECHSRSQLTELVGHGGGRNFPSS